MCPQRVGSWISIDLDRFVNFLDFSDRSWSGAAANRAISTTRARMRQTSYWAKCFRQKTSVGSTKQCFPRDPTVWRWWTVKARIRDPNYSKIIEKPWKFMKINDNPWKSNLQQFTTVCSKSLGRETENPGRSEKCHENHKISNLI